MPKKFKGLKGNTSTRYSKIGNTSWEQAQLLQLIDRQGKIIPKNKRILKEK